MRGSTVFLFACLFVCLHWFMVVAHYGIARADPWGSICGYPSVYTETHTYRPATAAAALDSQGYDVAVVTLRMDYYLEQTLATVLSSERISMGGFRFLKIASSNLIHGQSPDLLPSTSAVQTLGKSIPSSECWTLPHHCICLVLSWCEAASCWDHLSIFLFDQKK